MGDRVALLLLVIAASALAAEVRKPRLSGSKGRICSILFFFSSTILLLTAESRRSTSAAATPPAVRLTK